MAAEVVIGFAVGYWAGTRQGRQGMARALDAARDIWESPETRRVLAEGLSALREVAPVSGILGKGGSEDKSLAVIRDVLDDIVERRHGRRTQAA
jgi:hypothetical protein